MAAASIPGGPGSIPPQPRDVGNLILFRAAPASGGPALRLVQASLYNYTTDAIVIATTEEMKHNIQWPQNMVNYYAGKNLKKWNKLVHFGFTHDPTLDPPLVCQVSLLTPGGTVRKSPSHCMIHNDWIIYVNVPNYNRNAGPAQNNVILQNCYRNALRHARVSASYNTPGFVQSSLPGMHHGGAPASYVGGFPRLPSELSFTFFGWQRGGWTVQDSADAAVQAIWDYFFNENIPQAARNANRAGWTGVNIVVPRVKNQNPEAQIAALTNAWNRIITAADTPDGDDDSVPAPRAETDSPLAPSPSTESNSSTDTDSEPSNDHSSDEDYKYRRGSETDSERGQGRGRPPGSNAVTGRGRGRGRPRGANAGRGSGRGGPRGRPRGANVGRGRGSARGSSMTVGRGVSRGSSVVRARGKPPGLATSRIYARSSGRIF